MKGATYIFGGLIKINGFTDSHTQCDRCGKSELSGTYNIETDGGAVFHLGKDCIKKAWQMSEKEFDSAWVLTYKQRVSKAKDAFYGVAENEISRTIINAARIKAANKYGIKSEYEL